jgi:hypothetical protein
MITDKFGIPTKPGDFICTWLSGEGVTVKRVDEFVHEKPIVDRYTVCHSKFVNVTAQIKDNHQNYPEFFI